MNQSSFILFAGDIAFLFMISGRAGFESNRCPCCDLKQKEWNYIRAPGTPHPVGEPLTYERLCNLAYARELNPDLLPTDNHGVSCKPSWEVDPKKFLVPVLHVSMGLANDVLDAFTDNISRNVDEIDLVEEEARKERQKQFQDLEDMKEELRVKEIQRELILTKLGELKAQDWRCLDKMQRQRRSEKMKRYNNEKKTYSTVITKTKKKIDETKVIINKMTGSIDKLVKKRSKDCDSSTSLIYEVLKDFSIYQAQYHGGALINVHCKILMSKCDDIFTQIEAKLVDFLQAIPEERRRFTVAKLKKVLDHYKTLLKTLDSVMATLHILVPTLDDCEHLKKSVILLEKLWDHEDPDLGIKRLSKTIKAHLIFGHAYEQFVKLKGFGDKNEEYIEKRHQIGKNLMDRTKRMKGGFVAQQKQGLKYRAIISDNKVKQCINKVHEWASTKAKKKKKTIVTELQLKRERMEKRKHYVETETNKRSRLI